MADVHRDIKFHHKKRSMANSKSRTAMRPMGKYFRPEGLKKLDSEHEKEKKNEFFHKHGKVSSRHVKWP